MEDINRTKIDFDEVIFEVEQEIKEAKNFQKLVWLKKRQKGIGGSDIPVLMGLQPFGRDKLTLYYEKLTDLTIEDITEPDGYMKTGVDLEPSTLRDYERLQGVKLNRAYGGYKVHRHPDHPQLLATIDGFDTINNTVVEVKIVTNKDSQAEWEDDEGEYKIPEKYELQVAHYCNVMNADKADVIVRFMPSNKEVILRYRRDKAKEEAITKAALDFWNSHIVPKVEPALEVDTYDTALKHFDIDAMNPEVKPKVTPEIQQSLSSVQEYQAKIKELTALLKAEKAKILQHCVDNSSYYLCDDAGTQVVSVVQHKGRQSIDAAKLKARDLEMYKDCLKKGKDYNVLKIKGVK